MDRHLIDRYAGGARVLHEAVEGLAIGELVAVPVPGMWSIHQLVLHLADADVIGAERMKRIIAEDKPQLPGFDEKAFADKLFYHHVNIWWACDLFEKNRLIMSEILRRLPDEAFNRVGIHSEKGEVSLGRFVEIFVNHLEHHMKYLRQKRQILGRPL